MFHVGFYFENDPKFKRYMELNSWDEVQEFLCGLKSEWEVWMNGNLLLESTQI